MDISFPEIEKFDRLPDPIADGPLASVSIQEGCSKYCKYCIVPYTRGPEVDRPFDDVLYEINTLAEQGVREITMLGQNVNAYRGKRHDGQSSDLGELIAYTAEIPGIERIRFMTSHPMEFNETLVQAYKNVPKLVSHLHLPIQSGSNRILHEMGRYHSVEMYITLIERLRAIRPGLTLTSDFIVGYPGETEEDFEQTLDLVAKLNMDFSFSFIYSKRPGTPAADFPDDTPESVKKARLDRLQELTDTQGRAITKNMQNTTVPVLVLGVSRRDPMLLMGKTENNRAVHFSRGHQSMIGQIVPVMITELHAYGLGGYAT